MFCRVAFFAQWELHKILLREYYTKRSPLKALPPKNKNKTTTATPAPTQNAAATAFILKGQELWHKNVHNQKSNKDYLHGLQRHRV